MISKLLSSSSLALLFAASPLIAQDFSDAGESSSSATFTEVDATSDGGALGDVAVESSEDGVGSFFFPGGYGFLPEIVSPGVGIYARPPVEFSLSLETGYNDNIYNRSGKVSGLPKKGSATTEASAGINLLINTPRTFLSLGGSVGALYYWEKEKEQVAPVGNISAAFAHSFTRRLQLNARVNGGYYSQPDLSQPNAPVANAGDYLNLTGLFDLSYRWTPVFSTNTTFGANTQIFENSSSQDSNYVNWFVGESFRYLFSPRFTGVGEVRLSTIQYDDSIRDSTTESVLAGFDWMMTPRLTSTFRGGVSFRQFDLAGVDDAVSPFFEGSLGYRYGRGSLLQWNNRFGFEEARDPYSRNQTFRTSLLVSQGLTARLNASLGISYAFESNENDIAKTDFDQHLIAGSARLEFIATRSLTLFSSYYRSQNVSDRSNSSFTRNEVSVGARYQF